MKVKFKKLHPEAVMPTYAKNGDAGLDLTAISRKYVSFAKYTSDDYWEYETGIAVEIPEGYVGLIFPRSSIFKKDLILTNHVGVIDSSFRGDIKFKFRNYDREFQGTIYEKGDRIGQLLIIPYPQIELDEVQELSESERGTGGYGSSGS